MARKKEMCSSENHEPGAGIVLMKLEELNQSLQQSNDDQRNTGLLPEKQYKSLMKKYSAEQDSLESQGRKLS